MKKFLRWLLGGFLKKKPVPVKEEVNWVAYIQPLPPNHIDIQDLVNAPPYYAPKAKLPWRIAYRIPWSKD